MVVAAFTVAIGLLGFVVGLTFAPTAPGTLLVSGVAAIGWTLSVWLAVSRHQERLLRESLNESVARLWGEKMQLERDLSVARRRAQIAPVYQPRRDAVGQRAPELRAPAVLSSHRRSA